MSTLNERALLLLLRGTRAIAWTRASIEQFGAALATKGLTHAEIEELSIAIYERNMHAYNPSMGLFDWEERAFAEHLPPPPARIFIPGAGSGREVVALDAMGYEVWASDPTETGARALRALIGDRARRASFEDFLSNRESMPQVDAVVFGWGCLTHCLGAERRLSVMQIASASTTGPILVSLFTGGNAVAPKAWRLGARTARACPSLRFVSHAGYFEYVDSVDCELLADRSERTLTTLRESGPKACVFDRLPRPAR